MSAIAALCEAFGCPGLGPVAPRAFALWDVAARAVKPGALRDAFVDPRVGLSLPEVRARLRALEGAAARVAVGGRSARVALRASRRRGRSVVYRLEVAP